MLGLFGTLEMGNRSLQTQRQGVEVTGQNLANVNNPAYARQRLTVQTSIAVQSQAGPQGTGVRPVAIQQLRDALIEKQLRNELSVEGYLQSEQEALENAQAQLGETLSSSGSDATANSKSATGLIGNLTSLFTSFQELAAHPESLMERQRVIASAEGLASQIRNTDLKLASLTDSLNQSVTAEVKDANTLLKEIAGVNHQISQAELGDRMAANDLRDLRQQKLQALSSLVSAESSENPNGTLNVTIDGTLMVEGGTVAETLESFDAGQGRMLVRAAGSGAALTITGGNIGGTIAARDGTVATLRNDLNALASSLIAEVNAVHAAGFNLAGGTGANFFTGSGSADIGVNTVLAADPRLIQASGAANEAGNNDIAVQLAGLMKQPTTGLGQRTFYDHYTGMVTSLGQAIANCDSRLEDQAVVQNMLRRKVDSVSGVSIDEEMTELMKYQKAFEASARLVSTVSEMLDEIVNLKR